MKFAHCLPAFVVLWHVPKSLLRPISNTFCELSTVSDTSLFSLALCYSEHTTQLTTSTVCIRLHRINICLTTLSAASLAMCVHTDYLLCILHQRCIQDANNGTDESLPQVSVDSVEQEEWNCFVTVDKVTQTPDAVLCALQNNRSQYIVYTVINVTINHTYEPYLKPTHQIKITQVK